MDIMDLLINGNPQQQQMTAAQMMRSRENLNGALQQNRQDASKYDLMNFAATAAGNNPGLAAATGGLQKTAQARSRVQPLGQSSVIVGDQVLENPEYQEKTSNDQNTRLLQAAAMLQSRREAADTRQQTAQQMEEGRMERAQMMIALRQGLAGQAASTRADKAAEKAAAAAAGKTMPAGQATKVGDSEYTRDMFSQLAGSFKEEYAGSPVVAGLTNTLGKYGVDKYRDQSNWWQNYAEQSNKVRHALFGSALTANEQTAFEQATIKPGMDPKEIMRRLGQQSRAAALAHQKMVGSLGRAGYNVSGFDTEVPTAAAPGGAAPAVSADDALINKYLPKKK